MRQRLSDGWSVRPKVNFFAEMAGASSPWEPVRLPHDAMLTGSRTPDASSATGYFRGGVWEYKITIAAPSEWRERRIFLEFEGVYRGAMVYVNDDLAATRPFGYSQFAVRLDPFLRFGADNTVRVDARVHDDSRWYPGAGIYRPVWLRLVDPIHIAIDGISVTTPEIDEDAAVVVVATQIENETAHTHTVRVGHEIDGPDGEVVASGSAPVTVRSGQCATVRQRFHVPGPHLWGPDHPSLYACRTKVVEPGDADRAVEEDSTTFGIRSLSLDARRGFRVNGEEVKLRGACIHHDNGALGAATIERAEERRVEILKSAGFNALRSAHQPMSRAMLEACDRLGVLVMDEAFDSWTEPKADHDYAVDFSDWWRTDIEAMVRKDRNHPCVVMYSIGNEIPEVGSPLGAALGRDLAEHVRALDPTRFVTDAVQPLLAVRGFLSEMRSRASGEDDDHAVGAGVNTQMAAWADSMGRLVQSPVVAERTEEAFAHVDVAGYNYLDSRYEIDHQLFPNRVIVGSETYPTNIDVNWSLVEANSHVIGDFTWTGWDYLGEAGIGRIEYGGENAEASAASVIAGFPWMLASCGDIDITGHRLAVSYYREIVFGLRSAPYIAVRRPSRHGVPVSFSGPWSWSDVVESWSWPEHSGQPIVVEVYSADEEVELVLNGTSLGRQSAGAANRFRAIFELKFAPGELTAIGWSGGAETQRTTLVSASGEVSLAATVDRARIRADDTDLAFVSVALVDPAGNLHNTSDRAVRVEVGGPAVLAGFGTGDPAPLEGFGDPVRTTFDGRALAIVRPTGAGRIDITVSTEGCTPVSVVVDAVPAWGADLPAFRAPEMEWAP